MNQPGSVPEEREPPVMEPFQTRILARLDRLPWSRFHWVIVLALGITWILDDLEVTLTGAISGVLQEPGTLHFTSSEIGFTASFYLTGAVLGSLFFGYLTDRLGRKRLFFITLGVYLTGTLLTGFSWNLWSFITFRFITGSRIEVSYGYLIGALLMLTAAGIEIIYGVKAERMSLEKVAEPLSAVDKEAS